MEPIFLFHLPIEPVLSIYLEHRGKLSGDHNEYTSRDGVLQNHPDMVKLHHEAITPMVSKMLGYPVKPSYSFLSEYSKGAHLGEHTDREMCVWTLSHMIYVDPMDAATDWEIYIDGIKVGLKIGSAVLFRGRELKHYRLKMPEHINKVLNVYFHFTAMNYDGPLL